MIPSKIPRRMMPFTGLCAIAALSLILSGCGSKPPVSSTDTQQKVSESSSSGYDSANVAVTSGEATPSGDGQYDSSGSKVTFDPPSYRSGTGYSTPASTATEGGATYEAPATVSQTNDGTVYVSVDKSTLNLLRAGKSSTIAFVTATPIYHGTPVFHGVNRSTDPVFHGVNTGNTADPVFHGAHW